MYFRLSFTWFSNLISLDRMGAATWNGIPLYSGYQAYIGNKVIELDNEVSSSQLPKITSGNMHNDVIDVDDFDMEGETLGTSVQRVNVQDVTPNTALSGLSDNTATTTHQKFIAPTSFYAKPTETTKTLKPL